MGNFIKHRSSQGFTLIELLVAIAIMALILTFGIPAFNNLIEKTSIKTTAEEIVDLLRLARLTAVEQSTPITVCGSSDASGTCSGDPLDWGDTMLVTRAAGDGSTQTLARIKVSDRVNVSKTGTVVQVNVEFNASGWSPAGAGSFYVCPKSGDSVNAIRIKLALSGKVSTETHPGDGTWDC